MIPSNHLLRCFSFLLFIAGINGTILAQKVIFTAATNESRVCKGEKVQVQFVIKDAQNLQSISPLATNDFVIVAGPFQQETTESVKVGCKYVSTQSVTLTYVLRPKYEGNFIIAPAVAKDASGHIYQSNPISIQVVPAATMEQTRHPFR